MQREGGAAGPSDGALSPAAVRRLRLASDHRQMRAIQGSVIRWEALRGTPPWVEEYRVTLRIRSIVAVTGGRPQYRDVHVVRLLLPNRYPIAKPQILMESEPPPFHPNWWSYGLWCCGDWSPAEGLGDHVVRMARTLQFDREITNEHSPANSRAAAWYRANRRSGLFPCDTQRLPDPSSLSGGGSFVVKGRG